MLKNLNLWLFPTFIFFCLLFITAGTATAADLCADAVGPLPVPSVTAGTTIGATVDAVPGGLCGTSVTAPGVWYMVIGTGGVMTVDTCGSAYDSKLSVFSGGCAVLTCVGGNDDYCGLQSGLSFDSVAGVEYLILVHGFATATGSFNLNIGSAPSTAPLSTTQTATSVIITSATLNGLVNANGKDATVTFEYGLDTSYGSIVAADQNLVTGSTDTAVSAAVANLSPGTVYHFRVVAQNSSGTTNGDDMTFTTAAATQTAIPTLSEWGMIFMSLMLAGSAFWMMRRRIS
ncbi:MAG: IPTL-CTERM sorting domain-containing protein [Desulfobacteraceae bacterium]|nr:MAG: IPTL-CTERM sorting domain-containing protein [Desulfobacteraceae bacterium]